MRVIADGCINVVLARLFCPVAAISKAKLNTKSTILASTAALRTVCPVSVIFHNH